MAAASASLVGLEQFLSEERLAISQLLASRHRELLRRLEEGPPREEAAAAEISGVAEDRRCKTSGEEAQETVKQEDREPESKEFTARDHDRKGTGTSVSSSQSKQSAAKHFHRMGTPVSVLSTESRHRIYTCIDHAHTDHGPDSVQLSQEEQRVPSAWASACPCSGAFSWRSVLAVDFRALVLSTTMEMTTGLFILLNAMVIAVEVQYEGYDNAYATGFGQNKGQAMWPGASTAFNVVEWIFGLIFSCDLLLRAWALHCRRMNGAMLAWTVLDSVVVTLWLVEKFSTSVFLVNPLMLRALRLVRLVRLMRLVRWVTFFDPLHLMIKSIQASVGILFWSLVVLLLSMMIIAMMVNIYLTGYIRDPNEDLQMRQKLYQDWGSFARAFVTMFEITLANWGPPCWRLMNSLGEHWGFLFIVYKCSFGFAVVQVITSVFIQQTFKMANRDEEVMIKEKLKASAAYMKSLERLFSALDESGDGVLTWEEFEHILLEPRIKAWFGALEVDTSELAELFRLLDTGSGQIHSPEFINAFKKIKGTASAMDMLSLQRETRALAKSLSNVVEAVETMSKAPTEVAIRPCVNGSSPKAASTDWLNSCQAPASPKPPSGSGEESSTCRTDRLSL